MIKGKRSESTSLRRENFLQGIAKSRSPLRRVTFATQRSAPSTTGLFMNTVRKPGQGQNLPRIPSKTTNILDQGIKKCNALTVPGPVHSTGNQKLLLLFGELKWKAVQDQWSLPRMSSG